MNKSDRNFRTAKRANTEVEVSTSSRSIGREESRNDHARVCNKSFVASEINFSSVSNLNHSCLQNRRYLLKKYFLGRACKRPKKTCSMQAAHARACFVTSLFFCVMCKYREREDVFYLTGES